MRTALLSLLTLLGVALPATAGEGGAVPARRTVVGGVALELALEPAAGPAAELREGDAVVRFRLSDAATGTPLTGAYPAAWLDRVGPGGGPPPPCIEKVEEFLGGNLFNRPAVDLNVYYVLALNQDGTITVVDPLFGFGGTKLLALVELGSPGEDWALGPDRRRLFVTLPATDRVAVVDTVSWKIAARLDVGTRPGRVALQPDGAYLWVGVDGGVAVVDTRSLEVAARIPTGRGGHEIALSDDSRFAFVTNREDGTVSVIDVARLAKVHDVGTDPAPSSVAFSARARAAYVTSEESGAITAVPVPGQGAERGARIAAEPGLSAIRFAPGSGLAFVLNPGRNRLYLLDSATNRLVQRADIEFGPDQVTFSKELAYLRQRNSDTILMVPLDEIGQEGAPIPAVDFTGGQNAMGKGALPSPADSIVQAAGAAAVLVANPADRVIYYYKEGMAAPMGSFTNYNREPRAVLVIDRSLKERTPGSYETIARLDAGRHRVAIFLDSPRTIHCFDVDIAADPVLAAERLRELPLRVEPRLPGGELRSGESARLRFRLSDPVTGAPRDGLSDVTVLVFLASGTWNQRRPAQGLGDGLYEIELVPPAAGSYRMAVESPSQRLSFHHSPPLFLRVVDAVSGTAPPPSAPSPGGSGRPRP